jgi:hypothetical protein
MLKTSSLCLYVSNLGTFWLKIEQFWPFEELDGPLPKLCQAVALSRQDGRHSAVALLLKAALIQVSDYRLL